MHRLLLAGLLLLATEAHAINVNAACPVTVGTLTLTVSTPRAACISPCLVFFDATATTDSSITGTTTVFQDVTFTWNFGDTGASGTSTWAYGSRPGINVRNKATGGIASHLYIAQGRDTKYTATVTATNGTNTAVCGIGATAYNPSGVNGFPTTATTCASASGTPVAGSAGCPSGANVLNTSSFATALGATYMGNNKRLLFKCGDSFTGTLATFTAVKFSIGAYGGCENTQTNRPILTDTAGNGHIAISVASSASGDGRVADLDLEGSTGTGAALQVPAGNNIVPYQLTWYNIASNNNGRSYYTPQGSQFGLIASTQTTENNIGTYINNGGNNPTLWTGPFPNDNYQALLGNSLNGAGVGNVGGIELVRVGACRLCVIENNDLQHANNVGAVLKFHGGNGGAAPATWSGVYTELAEISDNKFFDQSGGQLVEVAPQNNTFDERIRNIVIERNIFQPIDGVGRALLLSAVNSTVRDNVFFTASGQASPSFANVQVGQRGIEPVPQAVEFYNNIGYALSGANPQSLLWFSGLNFVAAGNNSFAKNNLFFTPQSGQVTVTDQGTGNTVSNNTATPTSNPLITNGSGSFSVLSDFKPTANYTGGVSVPVFFDALGTGWSPTWDLGAVHH